MGTIISTVLLLMQTYICLVKKNFRQSISFYYVCALCAPVFHIGGYQVSYIIMGSMMVIACYLLYPKNSIFRCHKGDVFILAMFGIMYFSTFASILLYSVGYSLIPLFSTLRSIILFYITKNVWDRDWRDGVMRVFQAVLLINTVVVAIQIMFNREVEIWAQLYDTPGNGIYEILLESGSIGRPMGTMGVIYLGIFMMSSVALFLSCYLFVYRKKEYLLYTMLSLFIGILSSSRTFWLGCTFLLAAIFALALLQGHIRVKTLRNIFLFVIVTVLGIVFIISQVKKTATSALSAGFLYRMRTLMANPISIFTSRYSSDAGNLTDTFQIFREHPWIGVGMFPIKDEFLGDSTYAAMLHNGGVLGFACFLLAAAYHFSRIIKKKDYTAMFVCLSLLLGGIGMSLLTHPLTLVVVGYIQGEWKQKTKE